MQSGGPFVGTASWALPREEQPNFPPDGTHLERYATRFTAVEINSSFYRPHRTKTYERWAASVPEEFRFSVKMPKAITHERRLREADELLDAFVAESGGLGRKLGCILIQLPPSFVFEHDDIATFLNGLRERTSVGVVLEPRHRSWASDSVDDLLTDFRVGRVMADPIRIPGGEDPGGWTNLIYYRLHGSPETYRSCYSDEYLEMMAHKIEEDVADGREAWCMFDNTARNFATTNGLYLLDRLSAGPQP
ncbi:MAG: DUF72 domain-containing protein [bacterium]|nr:DUF72 domain-containing protein [Candidatus Kapabacteria bacterium]